MTAWAHGAVRRWAVVGALVGVLVGLPAVVAALPAEDADVPAARLRDAALASGSVGHSGYAVSAGGLSLPVTDRLTRVADLLSDRTTMRVWWRGPDEHRVDVVTAAGETGVHRDPGGTWTWDFETLTAARGEPASLALPAPPDLLPAPLGRRLLSEAADEELTRIGARRVAGRDALGLRLEPAEEAASVDRVDVWVDRATGLPLQVQVVAEGARTPALDTRFLDLDLAVPAASVVAFTPPPEAFVGAAPDTADLVAEAGRRAGRLPLPLELAGLGRRPLEGVPAAVWAYGRGVTLLAVASVPPRLAGGLRAAMRSSPEAVTDDLGVRLSAGPLGLMVVDVPRGGAYVLTGTVTLDALAAAAAALPGAAP
ncbi:sigma-E factor regulatory protein RseB domain-containing protein [Geodermatophilus sp. CPCC 206100]|uniref:sigma-E factor regulatory protein RseB domain-containing protein n=1 Tax=Geodermatophilus sp. CPCC 206100 TaxID=3020054 RepID=UPI003B00D7A4